MDLSTQSDWKELKLGVGIEPVWKTRSWPASQEHKFQRSAAIGFWEKSRVRPLSLWLLSSSSRDFFNLWVQNKYRSCGVINSRVPDF